MHRAIIFLSIALALTACKSDTSAPQLPTGNKIGDRAPTFTLPDTSGVLHSLDELRGRVVMIDFWATWCQPCIAKMPELNEVAEEYEERAFTLVGVSIDDNAKAWKRTIAELEMEWMQLHDRPYSASSQSTAWLYGVTYLPNNFLLDKNGNIVGRNLYGSALRDSIEKYL